MKQLFDGVYLLEGDVGGRPLQVVYLRGSSASLMFDSGCANDPIRFILPQLLEADGDPQALTWIVNSHPDLDHVGGNALLKAHAPQARLLCGFPDREACTGGKNLVRLRYETFRADHNIFYAGEVLDWIVSGSGTVTPIDLVLCGGERFWLSEDWELEVIHVPGHSKGHLALLDHKHQALYAADALHGDGYRGLDGTMKLCPTYIDVDDYLATSHLIEQLPISTYVGSHWAVLHGAEIAEFCKLSRDFVNRLEKLLLEQLQVPQTLLNLCHALGPSLGDWSRAVDSDLVYAIHGHLIRLVKEQQITAHLRTEPPHIVEYLHSTQLVKF
jgi:glyoxylase-like metal-dependent hydrolase (beta-lactamase superfamily II)